MAINYTYPVKGTPITSDEFLIIDTTDNSTKRVTLSSVLALGQGGDVGVASLVASSPIVNSGTSTDVSLTLSTVPVSKGGTALTALGSAHQVMVVNEAEDSLEYKDITTIETVKNVTGATITKGTPVHATGWSESDGVAEINAASASNPSLMPAIGLAENDIPAGEIGHIIVLGVLEEIRTNQYGVGVGDVLYVAPGGGLTGDRPRGTDVIQPVAVILKSAGSGAGVLQVATVSQGASIPNVQNAEIIVGNASNVGESVAVTGEVSLTNAGVTAVESIAGNISIQGYRPIVQVEASGSITPQDVGKTLVSTDTSGGTISIDLEDSQDYTIGTEIQVIQKGSSTVEVTSSGGTTINGTTSIQIAAQYGEITLKKYSDNDWMAFGDVQ